MKCAVGYALKIKSIDMSGKDMILFLDVATAEYLRKQFGYGRETILRYLNDTYAGMMHDMDWYSADNDGERNQIYNAYYGCINRLKYDGIDLKRWEEDIVKNHVYKVCSFKNKRNVSNNRIEFVKSAWIVTKAYYAKAMEWLHVDRGFGKTRCERAYRDLRKIYDDYIDHYLMCSDAGDKYCKEMIAEARRALGKLDIDINIKFGE